MHFRRAFFGSLLLLIAVTASLLYGNVQGETATTGSSGQSGAALPKTGTQPEAPAKTATAAVTIVQATSSAAIALGDIPTTRIAIPITLEERGGGIAKGVEMRIAPLLNANGAVLPRFETAAGVKLPADLQAFGQLSGTLVAELPHAGAYSSSLRLLYDGKIQNVFAITLSRAATAAAAAPTAIPLDPGELTDITAQVKPWNDQTVVVTTTLAPSGIEAVTVAMPELRTLSKKLGDKTAGADGASMTITDGAKKPVSFPLTLHPGSKQPLRFAIAGIDGGGHYDVKIRFGGPGHLNLDKTFVVRAREPWCIAFLCLLIGVGLSWLLRAWYTRGRPRLVLERRIANLEATVGEAAAQSTKDAAVKEVADAVAAQIARAWKNAVLAEAWSNDAPFVLLNRKVDLLLTWISTRVAVARTKPASAASVVANDMDGVESFLRSPAVTDETLKAHEKTLSEVTAKLLAAVSKEIRSRGESLKTQIEVILKNRPLLKPAVDAGVRPALARVTEKLDANDFDGALADIEEARKQYAIVLANALRSDLGRPKPEMVDARVWTNLQERLRFPLENVMRAENADDAMRRFETVLGTYTRELAAALIVSAKAALPAVTDAARKATLTNLIKSLDVIDTKIGEGKVIEAWNDIVTAHESLTEFDPRSASSMGDAATPARAMVFGLDDSMQEGIALGKPSALATRSFAEVDSALRWGDHAAAWAAMLITVGVGLGAVWNASLTWGGPGDYLAAITWGLGLHQFSYNGLAGLFEKFSK